MGSEKFGRCVHFGKGEELHRGSGSGYLWCLHCERAYEYGWFRLDGSLQMCPYAGCDGSTVLDGCSWVSVREHHPEYPVIPRRGVVYPLY